MQNVYEQSLEFMRGFAEIDVQNSPNILTMHTLATKLSAIPRMSNRIIELVVPFIQYNINEAALESNDYDEIITLFAQGLSKVIIVVMDNYAAAIDHLPLIASRMSIDMRY